MELISEPVLLSKIQELDAYIMTYQNTLMMLKNSDRLNEGIENYSKLQKGRVIFQTAFNYMAFAPETTHPVKVYNYLNHALRAMMTEFPELATPEKTGKMVFRKQELEDCRKEVKHFSSVSESMEFMHSVILTLVS